MELSKFKYREGVHLTTIDLFPVVTDFQKSAFARRVRTNLGDLEAWVVTDADLVLFKLLAYRLKDQADIENVMTVQGIPEPGYLDSWVERLGLEPRVDPFRQRFGRERGDGPTG